MAEDLRLLSIGEVARLVGIRPSALRFYEAEGLLAAPMRRGGQRRYEPGIVRRVAFIGCAQRAGFTIREIRNLFKGVAAGSTPSKQWRTLAARKLPEIQTLIRQAREMESWLEAGLRCECIDVNDCPMVDSNADGQSVRGRPPRSSWNGSAAPRVRVLQRKVPRRR